MKIHWENGITKLGRKKKDTKIRKHQRPECLNPVQELTNRSSREPLDNARITVITEIIEENIPKKNSHESSD